MSVCNPGEMIGGEDPLVCRKWYDPTPCRPPSVLGPYTKGVYLNWYSSQRWNASAEPTPSPCAFRPSPCSPLPFALPPPKPRCSHRHLADLWRTKGLTCLDCGKPPYDFDGEDS